MSKPTLKGPAFFTAQFFDADNPDYKDLDALCSTARAYGYSAISPHLWGSQLFSLSQAAASEAYCQSEIQGVAAEHGITIAEPANHVETQLMAVHPAYAPFFDGFAPKELRGKPNDQWQWAQQRATLSIKATHNMGHSAVGAFPGTFLFPYIYPFPQRAPGLVQAGFHELAKRWVDPLMEAFRLGVKVCFEVHPMEDIHDGHTWEMFKAAVAKISQDAAKAAAILFDPSHFILQFLEYIEFLEVYLEDVWMTHVKDASLNPTGKSGVYGGYQGWDKRAGRFDSPGDGQVNFKEIFRILAEAKRMFWAIMEWESWAKGKKQGLREGAPYIRALLEGKQLPENGEAETHSDVFDAFVGVSPDAAVLSQALGFPVTAAHLATAN